MKLKKYLFLMISMIFFSINAQKSRLNETSFYQSKNLKCADCDHVIESEIRLIDGRELNIKPGDVIGLSGVGDNFHTLTFNNIVGTKEKPIIIKNCDGRAIIESSNSFGTKFKNSKHFKILGNGDESYVYGIKISTKKGFFLTFENLTTDFEVSNIEIAGYEDNGIGDNNGFAGIGIKTSPYQYCDLFRDPTRKAWIMKNVTVKDCYIHDVGGEGLYIGHGFYNGRKESRCSEITYSHSIQHIRIHDNIIENVGYDGIQIKNADLNCEVYNNVIRNYGTQDKGPHNEGLFIGGGTTGKFYNNYVIKGTGHGIQFQGIGNVDIYNNVIVDSGDNGFFGASGPQVYRIPDGYFNIINNTFINSGAMGFVFHNNGGGVKRLINNIFALSGEELYRQSATIELASNILTQNIEELDFKDVSENNYDININSQALNVGEDTSVYNVINDILGNKREDGFYDIGAYEFISSLSVGSIKKRLNTGIEVSPNPVITNVTFEMTNEYQFDSVIIYNLKGEKVKQSNNKVMNVSDLNEGVYLAKVKNKKGFIFTKKIIKK